MTKSTVTTITCDICKEKIVETNYIDANYYGADFHKGCYLIIDGPKLAKILDLQLTERI